MQILRNVNIDWLGKKWYFLAFSLLGLAAGLASIFVGNGIPLGIDFKGGTIVTVRFSETVAADPIRAAVEAGGIKEARIQRYGPAENNEYLVALEHGATEETALEAGRQSIVNSLQNSPLAGKFEVRNVEVVGPQVGQQLREQALWATLFSLSGMLVFLWFRFEFVYGAAAVLAVFHDTLFTLGVFSLTNTELSLTVIAAMLTLIGYSMNDTIVIFDRIRENLKTHRRDSYQELVNRSINQTLARTVLTSGLTFLTAMSLYLFGGPVLKGFSLALVVGILVGTYSSVAIAAPMLVAYQEWKQKGQGGRTVRSETRTAEKVRA